MLDKIRYFGGQHLKFGTRNIGRPNTEMVDSLPEITIKKIFSYLL